MCTTLSPRASASTSCVAGRGKRCLVGLPGDAKAVAQLQQQVRHPLVGGLPAQAHDIVEQARLVDTAAGFEHGVQAGIGGAVAGGGDQGGGVDGLQPGEGHGGGQGHGPATIAEGDAVSGDEEAEDLAAAVRQQPLAQGPAAKRSTWACAPPRPSVSSSAPIRCSSRVAASRSTTAISSALKVVTVANRRSARLQRVGSDGAQGRGHRVLR